MLCARGDVQGAIECGCVASGSKPTARVYPHRFTGLCTRRGSRVSNLTFTAILVSIGSKQFANSGGGFVGGCKPFGQC